MISAVFSPVSGDTLTVVQGRRVPLDLAVSGDWSLPTESEWFLRDEALRLAGQEPSGEFYAYGTARRIDPTEVEMVALAGSVPIYAAATEAAQIRSAVDAIERAAADRDLGAYLDAAATMEQNRGSVVYAPLQRTGCVFQAFVAAQAVEAPPYKVSVKVRSMPSGARIHLVESWRLTSGPWNVSTLRDHHRTFCGVADGPSALVCDAVDATAYVAVGLLGERSAITASRMVLSGDSSSLTFEVRFPGSGQ